MSVSFAAKLIRMRIKKLVTDLHCFRVLISVCFSFFCAALSVTFLPRPQGSHQHSMELHERLHNMDCPVARWKV